jgi:hypothetical protein
MIVEHSPARLASLASATVLTLAVLGSGLASAANLAAHRAVYDLRMSRSNEGSNVSGVSGRLAYEVMGSACEGWTINFRMVNRFMEAESGTRLIDTQSTAWESGDGVDMRYNQKEYINNKLEGEKRIKVTRSVAGGDSQGRIDVPEEKDFTIPGSALFPMQHQFRILAAAARGDNRDSSVIYDGSDGEKTYQVVTFIGKKQEPGTNKTDFENPEALPLKALPSWPMTLSYYDTGPTASQDTPSYQVNLDMYENGVATDLLLDYGSFALEGKLANLEMLKTDPCE